MASRRSRGRSRYQRRRTHAVLTKGRPGLAVALLANEAQPVLGFEETTVARQTRATCPGCGNREKVKRDGTMGKHTSSYGGAERRDCPGVGRKPE